MRELTRLGLGLALALCAACTTGSAGDDAVGDDEPLPDELLCSNQLGTDGTAVLDPIPDLDGDGLPDVNGCWPIGTWTFTVSVGTTSATPGGAACEPTPQPLPQYQIRIQMDSAAENPLSTWIYTYLTDPADTTRSLSVSSGGQFDCIGSFTIYSPDGTKLYNLKPALDSDTGVIAGNGEYESHSTDQR